MVLVLADRIPLMGRLMDRTARMVPDGPPTAREAAVSLADCTSALASSLDGNNGLSISDFQIGDRITHDHYGLGKVIETQDKGANSVITVDFGTDGVKRLLLRVAPIEKL